MKMGTTTLLFLCISLMIFTTTSGVDVSHDGRALTINGERKIILSGSIHYPRSTPEMWSDLIKKSKEGGLDAIETYIFWNAHEPMRRQYDFSGNLDFIRFIKTIQDEGLYAVLRIGPYVCAEWNYGGFPVWLKNLPGIEFRTANDVFMNEMQNFTSLIVDMVKQENLFASQGGPIILAQLNTCNGYYCDQFEPSYPDTPKMWTENWTGWFKNWGGRDPLRMTEDVAFSVARFFQFGGTFQNYYMYHGGTNFGRTAGGPYITTSYDYDAPLNEFGSLNQPKYGHLKQLHDVLHSIQKTLTYGNVSSIDFGNSVSATIFATNDTESCMFGNANTTTDATINFQGMNYNVPAWSVSILPDCKNEVYNTAKVNTQTWKMVKETNEAENEPTALKWSWREEVIAETAVHGKGEVSTSQLLDQKVANDASDYMWYMTSLNLNKDDAVWSDNMTLRVNGTGHVMHAYVNGEYLGSQWATYGIFNYVFEKKVKLNPGKNQISLLSSTVGLQNYGPKFDTISTGLPGPIEIIGRNGDESIIKDLSKHTWTYKVGLDGLDVQDKLFDDNKFASQWRSEDLPINKMFTWYKTTFKVPLGEDPVVVDLLGLGKGLAWVNGNSLGRYWPSYLATEEGCMTGPCDYRGSYYADKCNSNCGQPTQRWYHVPRSFMNSDVNELILFEEFGGNPTLVNFQTMRPGTICGNAYENNTMEISCDGKTISEIKFASFGDVHGICGSFEKGTCEAKNDTLSIIQNACVGKESCSMLASESVFGSTNCDAGFSKRLVVEAIC
ncbi:hypothetical protein BUALT_Bualt06G0019200 [Buddleja alternifolia]|uniref:beta-galactosidase n=1 Tax=Buddleja alternifolia TaxID=168488 RepID=A0AAV6XN38_9LAMI|nr:hypothetical protein BUALT_Bualt06G0019200 [Buddleja alternifolia]